MLENGKWRKATGTVFDRLMKPDRTQRRLQASERTMEKARDRAARIRAAKDVKNARDYRRSVIRILRELGLSATGQGWGKWRHVRVRKAPKKRSCTAQKRVLSSRGGRVNLPKYARAIRDARGRVAVFLDIKYLGLKSKGWRKGLAADHTKYCFRADALEEAENQIADPISNVGNTPNECAALWNAIEPVEEGYRANAKVQMRFVGALPHFLTAAQRRDIVREFGEQAFGRYGLGYMGVVHAPDAGGDDRNWHFHLLATTRQVAHLGDHEWAFSDEKLTEAFTPEGLLRIRAIYAAVVNRHCRAAGVDNRYTHQSYENRNLDAFRTEKIGPARITAHESGEDVAVIERNRQRVAANEAGVTAQALSREVALQERVLATTQRIAELAVRIGQAARLDKQISLFMNRITAASAWDDCSPAPIGSEMQPAMEAVMQTCARAAPAGRATPIRGPIRIDAIPGTGRVLSAASNLQKPRMRGIRNAVSVRNSYASIDLACRKLTVAKRIGFARPQRISVRLPILIAAANAARQSFEPRKAIADEAKRSLTRIISTAAAIRTDDSFSSLRDASYAIPVLSRCIDAGAKLVSKAPPASVTEASGLTLDTVQRESQRFAATHAWRMAPNARSRITDVRDRSRNLLGTFVSPPIVKSSASGDLAAAIIHEVNVRRTITIRTGGTDQIIDPDDTTSDAKVKARPPEPARSVSGGIRAASVVTDEPGSSGSVYQTGLDVVAEQRPLAERVDAFAKVMREKPSGLGILEDGSVHPVAARADSWGLTKGDLATDIAKDRLLPLYVEQELRLHRLEIELKFACVDEKELADPDMKFASRLSPDAIRTLELHRRSLMLHEALHRVYRELWQHETVTSRTQKMKMQGVDWRAIFEATRHQRKAVMGAAEQISMQHNGVHQADNPGF
ncbi:MobA/MobL family protein [Citromicrobium bathyomarinum]